MSNSPTRPANGRPRFATCQPQLSLRCPCLSRSRAASLRAGWSFLSCRAAPSPPMRGGWSADRRTHSFGRACDARPPCPGATGTSLGAPPWRFSDADPRSRLPAVEPEPQRLPAPAVKAWRSGSGPPALRFAPQRGTPLLAPSFRIVSRKRPSEPGCESLCRSHKKIESVWKQAVPSRMRGRSIERGDLS